MRESHITLETHWAESDDGGQSCYFSDSGQ